MGKLTMDKKQTDTACTVLRNTLKVGVLMGGMSKEREISLATGEAIINALRGKGWKVIGLDVDRYVYKNLQQEEIEVAFLALHGKFGEDGCIQGILEIMGIPYTGSGVLASALAMNKIMTKRVFQGSLIMTPPFKVVEKGPKTLTDDSPFGYPVVVKPSSQGSTIGINIVKNREEFAEALSKAFQYDERLMVEEFIAGRELTVGILDDEPLPVIEIVPNSGFYDFYSKYTSGATEYICPAQIDEETTSEVQALAVKAHNVIGCRDFSRVDFRLSADNTPYCLEVNTIPGMTALSLLPKAAKVKGIGFPELAERILLRAWYRKARGEQDAS